MRLTMTTRRPVLFPDFNPVSILTENPCCTADQVWRAYGETLVEYNEDCMEACESASEIVSALNRKCRRISAVRKGVNGYLLSDGKSSLILRESDEGEITLDFPGKGGRLDISGFGPSDAAGIILALFNTYGKVASLGLMN
ncbi:MAG: hypothetical protein HUJ93_06535 [Bacteroidales bacterium]|nr:hypothetical protein [Bacteroidales bacterium]